MSTKLTASHQTCLLEVEHLSITFESFGRWLRSKRETPIADLSLSIETGEVVAIVGASGSGKSLLAHAILGILPANSKQGGIIRYRGDVLTQKTKEELRRHTISLIPQSITYLDPLIKVGRQVRNVIYRRDRNATAQRTLNRYFTNDRIGALYPFQLSGGMARRALIAMGVSRGPQLIIADEPTPGLDRPLVVEVLKHLRELADSGCGVLMITHDISAAVEIADRIAVFRDGTTIEVADRAAFDNEGSALSHPFSRELWRRLPQNDFVDISEPPPRTTPANGNQRGSNLLASNLTFGYQNRPAVITDFTLSVKPGEIVGLLGPSGQGKTTIARLLAGYIKPQAGTISIGNVATSAITKQPNPIQLLHQHPELSLNPRWTMQKALKESPPPHAGLLTELGIRDEWLPRHPHELSGGELQRFCLARVLNPFTQFLIVDEMTAMLDSVTQATIWQVMLTVVNQHHMGLIVISHEPAIIERVCHRTVTVRAAAEEPDTPLGDRFPGDDCDSRNTL